MEISAPDNLLVSSDLEKSAMANMKIPSSKPGKLSWSELVEGRSKRRWKLKHKQRVVKKNWRQIRHGSVLLKRRRGPSRALRRANCRLVKRKVKTLKDLVPNSCASEDMDGLFQETAGYILNLQMKVELMQVMVEMLSPVSNN